MDSMSSSREVKIPLSIERIFLNMVIVLLMLNSFAFTIVKRDSAEYCVVILNFMILAIFLVLLVIWIRRRT